MRWLLGHQLQQLWWMSCPDGTQRGWLFTLRPVYQFSLE